MECPICNGFIDEHDREWISEYEIVYQARCEKCGWDGNVSYTFNSYWDYRTDKAIPTDDEGFKKWREENSQFYNVAD